jgi:hypothetical protein
MGALLDNVVRSGARNRLRHTILQQKVRSEK